MADETADASNKEQVVFCFRWVSDDLTYWFLPDTIEANSLVNIIKDAFRVATFQTT